MKERAFIKAIGFFLLLSMLSGIPGLAQKYPTLNTNAGISIFHEYGLTGPTIGLDLAIPLFEDKWLLEIGIQNANAHSIHYLAGAPEGTYNITTNALELGFGYPIIIGKNNIEVCAIGAFHYTGYSFFVYKDVQGIGGTEIIQVREFYSTGRRKFTFGGSLRYYYTKKGRYKYGIQYEYLNFRNLSLLSLFFGVGL